MLSLYILGDGSLDDGMLEPMIRRILNIDISSRFDTWRSIRLNRGSGYGRKLKFVVRRIIADGDYQALVAVVDQDKDHKGTRITELRNAREASRDSGIPTAVGRAIPHGEAWLLDDHEAVKRGLGLPADTKVPSPTQMKNPKEALTVLYENSPKNFESRTEAWRCIAMEVRLDACRNPSRTGYGEFVEDLEREFAEMAAEKPS